MNKPELLCPAGDLERLQMALHFGADAVYLAGAQFGMRAGAENFTPDGIRAAVQLAHAQGAAVHVTCNTLPRDDEMAQLPAYLELLDDAGVAYEALRHPAVYTIDGLDALELPKKERIAKNLYLRDDKRRHYYLVVAEKGKRADLKALRRTISSRPLSFASKEETEKLLVYCSATGAARLTDEIVDEVVYPDSEYKIYELANALSRKNYSAYTHILKELSSKGFDEISLLNSLCYYFKGLYEVSLMRGSDREIAAALGIKEYAARKNREQALKFPKGELLKCYENVYDAISGIKCGELTPPSALKWVTARLFFGAA